MGKLSERILWELNRGGEQRRRTVGVLFQGNPAVVQQILSEGHTTIVLGERFRWLYSLYKQTQSAEPPKPLVVEARFDALPIRPGSLDALVLSQGLPVADLPRKNLVQLRTLLKDSGLLVWPHPITNGIGGVFRRLFAPYRRDIFRALPREQLTALAMESGFSEIGQTSFTRKLMPWVVTTGLATPRPWEKALPKRS